MKQCSKAKFLLAMLIIITLATTLSYTARADRDDEVRLTARLTGFQEVPPRLTTGHGTFVAKISADQQSITFTETWTDLTGPPLFSHIHFGQPGVAAGVVIFLCGPTGATNPNAPACEQTTTGSATGKLTATGVFNPSPDQGVNNATFADLLRIIRSGDAYANIHTPRFTPGEIRGQIRISRDEDEGDDH
jgi:hypothetical protein